MKRSPLNKVSKNKDKASKRFVPDKVIKNVKKRSGGICERVVSYNFGYNKKKARCWSDAMDQPHHILARSQGGKHTESNLLDLCFDCHNWATNNPLRAYAEGVSMPYRGYVHGSIED